MQGTSEMGELVKSKIKKNQGDLLCASFHTETCLYPWSSEPIHTVALLNVHLNIRQEIWKFVVLKMHFVLFSLVIRLQCFITLFHGSPVSGSQVSGLLS